MIIKIGGVDVIEQSKFLHNVRRVIGIKGRITIPYHIRMAMKIKYNDVLSFSIGDNPNTIVIEKLNICNHCNATPKDENVIEFEFNSENVKVNYTPNEEDWVNGTLTFEGNGILTIGITDNNCCEPTTLTVDIQPVEKFETKFTSDFLYITRSIRIE